MPAAKPAPEAPEETTAVVEPETPTSLILSAEDLAEIKAEAQKQFLTDRRKTIRQRAIKEELARLRREAGGDVVDGPMGEMVTMTIDLPDGADEIIWNQERIPNGATITRPRHVIAGILDIMYRLQMSEHNLSGRSRAQFYRQQRPVVVTPGGAQIDPTVRIT